MNIEFRKFSEFQRGLMFELLKDGYSFESRYERDWITNWKEAVNRITKKNVKKIIVTTDEQLLLAQKNYESVGFKFVQKRENEWNPEYAGKLIDYEVRA